MSNPKILIGCPVYERYKYCIDKYLGAIKALDYDNYDILLVDNSPTDEFANELKAKDIAVERVKHTETARERIIASRNMLRQKALDGGYDYFLSLEVDVIIRPDTLKRLLAHKKNIVSAYYGYLMNVTLKNNETGELEKKKIHIPVAYILTGPKRLRRANPMKDLFLDEQPVKIGAAGLGCMLISREALEKITFRYNVEDKAFDDIWFCSDARNLGYNIFLDGNVRLHHLHKEWKGIKK